MIFWLSLLSLFTNTYAASPAPQDAAAKTRELLAAMIAADTSNPPGNEARITQLVGKRLKEAGIPYETFEFAPGRENLVARLKGNGTEKPILFLAHIDVVGASGQKWTVPPHKLTEKDGYLYGRGVMDDLGMAAASIETLILIKQSGVPLRRDLIVALTGDEESNGAGIQHLLNKYPEKINAVVAFNEGGGLTLDDSGKVKILNLQVAEKTYQDFKMSVKGTTGHSSVPMKDNAIYRLSAALEKIGKHQFPISLSELTRTYLAERSKVEKEPVAGAMLALAKSKGKLPKAAVETIEKDPSLSAGIRTTCVATLVNGGTRVNALPAEATANVNCRVLPEDSPEAVLKTLASVVSDPTIEIAPVEAAERAPASPVRAEGVEAVKRVAQAMFPGVPIIPFTSRGATDSRYLRQKGIAAYGIDPLPITEVDARRMHGVDERLPLASLGVAVEFLQKLALDLAASPKAE